MTATTQPAAGIGGWHAFVIGAVGVLAVGGGLAAGSFLLSDRAAGTGAAASYVPGDAPFYLEWRLDPSAEQDAGLRELLGHFPPIEGLDLDRPLYDQLGEVIDEQLAEQDEMDITWSADVAPWFDGSVAFAVTDIDLEAMAEPLDPLAEPPMPAMLVVAGVTEPEAARAFVGKLVAEAEAEGDRLTTTEYRGITIHASADGEGAFAVTDTALLAAADSASIQAAIDTAEAGDGALAGTDEVAALVEALPSDWIGFAVYDLTEIMAVTMSQAEAEDAAMAEAMRELMGHQPMRGALAITAAGDRLAMTGAAPQPTGPFSVENADRGLASEVPGDALFYSESGNIGEALSAVLGTVKEAAASDPAVEEQISMAEAALGADLEELGAWIDDGAIVAGWGGTSAYGGLLLVPNDVDVAERRLAQLSTFAGLAAMDPSSGVTVSEREVAGTTVTRIEWSDPNAMADAMPGVPTGLTVELAVTDDRAIIGLGDAFVELILEGDPAGSLAAQPRYAEALADLGGATNAGVAWMDLRGTREALEAAFGSMFAFVDPDGVYETGVKPWLLPLDRGVAVTRLEGELLVQRSALFIGE